MFFLCSSLILKKTSLISPSFSILWSEIPSHYPRSRSKGGEKKRKVEKIK